MTTKYYVLVAEASDGYYGAPIAVYNLFTDGTLFLDCGTLWATEHEVK